MRKGVKKLKLRKAPGVWGVARDVKSRRRSGNEMVGIVIQYGMESRCGPSRLEKSTDHPHLQEG